MTQQIHAVIATIVLLIIAVVGTMPHSGYAERNSLSSGEYQRTCAASGGVFVTLTQTAANGDVIERGTACLYDDGTHGDIRANDEIYTTDYIFDNVFEGDVEVNLFLAAPHANYVGGDIELDSKHLAVVQEQTNPELIVITDWQAIYKEFMDTGGMPDGYDRGNCDDDPEHEVHDFVSFVNELVRFTDSYSGTIIDMTQEISTTNGYSGNYADIPYLGADDNGLEHRHRKAQLIDELVNKYTTGEHGQTKYVFIVGDDEVIPQYRIPDPTDTYCTDGATSGCSLERGYLSADDDHTNETLFDVTQGYIMSDLPYATTYVENISLAHDFWLSDEAKRDELRKPKPDVRVGRVFANSPCGLKYSLQRYMKPLKVDKVDVGDGNWASRVFVGNDTPYENDNGEVDDAVINTIMTQIFASVTEKHYPPWSESDLFAGFWKTVKTQPGMVLLTLIGHADHQHFIQGVGNNDRIPGSAYSNLTLEDNEYMSVVMPVLASHYGLSLSKGSETVDDRFVEANVHNLLDNGRDVTLFAPTCYAHVLGVPEGSETLAPSLTSRLISLFVNRMSDQTLTTIGDVWQSAYEAYVKVYPSISGASLATISGEPIVNSSDPGDLFHIKVAYGMGFYGSPIRSLGRDMQDLCPVVPTANADDDVSQRITVTPVIGTNQVNVYPNGVTGYIVLALSIRNNADEVVASERKLVNLDDATGNPPVVTVTFDDVTFTEGYSFIPSIFLCGDNESVPIPTPTHRVLIPLIQRQQPLPQCNRYLLDDIPAAIQPLAYINSCCDGVPAAALHNNDYYLVPLQASDTITVALSKVPANADYDLALYDSRLGDYLAYSTNRGPADETITYTANASGNHYVRVWLYAKNTSNNRYQICVTTP